MEQQIDVSSLTPPRSTFLKKKEKEDFIKNEILKKELYSVV